jgi:hypothetical protein
MATPSNPKDQKEPEPEKTLAQPPPETLKLEPERTQFRALILQNPNHFGNLKNSLFKPVKSILSNTTYEELKCVGLQPQLNRLEAVVWVKQAAGYSGGICSSGSTEYVRFWLSYDNGATWLDQGMESFTAYDIPGDHPLEYAVSLSITPHRRFCFSENLPLVRAILSWNHPPTDPHTLPVWGNVVDARIQIAPGIFFDFPDFLKEIKAEIKPELAQLIDPAQSLKLNPPEALSAAQLRSAYAGKDVPEHRFLHGEIQKYLAHPELTAALSLPQAKGLFSELEIDLAKVFASLAATNGDTSFEELTCVGLDPDSSTPDALMGVVRIKRPNGYLGGLCRTGSIEYVAFWVDWGGGTWDWVGTAQVRVHDIAGLPPGGLAYAVYQPVNLEAHRKPCEKGPAIARVRAILSWNAPPSPGNPDFVPPWGNRIETHVHIYPGAPAIPGDYTPYIQNLCGVAVCNIDQTTGFAPGERPFGGSVAIFGHIPGAPNVLTPAASRPRYRISVRQGGPPEFLSNVFNLTVDEQLGGGLPTSTNIAQNVEAGDYYVYQEAPPVPGVGWRTVSPSRLLAVWNSAGKTGLWEIRIEALDPATLTPYAAGTVLCVLDGTTRQNVIVDLDQAAPITSLNLTGYQRGGVGPVLTDILNCGTFQVGDLLHGSYSVSDEHFGGLSLTAEPIAGGAPGRFTIDGLTTSSKLYPALPGQPGTWTFDTAGLDPCGYTIQLSTADRTIVSCVGGWENNSAFVGFCLVAAPKV